MNANCKTVQERLSRFLDDDLSASEATELVAHLETCPVCRHAHDRLQAVQALTARERTAPRLPGSDAMRQRVLARVEQATRAPSAPVQNVRQSRVWRVPSLALSPWQSVAATLGAAALVAGVVYLMPVQDEEAESLLPPATSQQTAPASGDEFAQLLRLHDAHSDDAAAQDATLHRTEAADTHAALLAADGVPPETAL